MHSGYDAILEHENNRVEYFRRGYAAFLEPLKNVAMGGISLCMNMPGAAKQKLQAFLNRWRTHAEISYQLYISRERTGVETDNTVGNYNYDEHDLFIGFKSMYQVQDAQYTQPTPEKGNCPTNP